MKNNNVLINVKATNGLFFIRLGKAFGIEFQIMKIRNQLLSLHIDFIIT